PESLQSGSWDHEIVNDLPDGPPGFRSALRMAIRLDDRIAGALSFLSKSPSAFTRHDLLAARRVAERVALSLARERGDEANARAARLEARVRMLSDELDARSGYRRVAGESASWKQVITQAAQVATTETTVLLLGESGTGKEVVARLLHRGSTRRDG